MNLLHEPLLLTSAVLGTAAITAAVIIALAVVHLGHVLRRVVDDALRNNASGHHITDDNWHAVVSQAAADVLGESVHINTFAGMTAQQGACSMRFVLRDMRVLVFSTCVDLRSGHRLDACSAGEMNAVWVYFARHTGQSVAVPRHRAWRAAIVPVATSPATSHPAAIPAPRWRLH